MAINLNCSHYFTMYNIKINISYYFNDFILTNESTFFMVIMENIFYILCCSLCNNQHWFYSFYDKQNRSFYLTPNSK